jgi:hypothetical protein
MSMLDDLIHSRNRIILHQQASQLLRCSEFMVLQDIILFPMGQTGVHQLIQMYQSPHNILICMEHTLLLQSDHRYFNYQLI